MKAYYDSPIGIIHIEASDMGVSKLEFAEDVEEETPVENEMMSQCMNQLDEYFSEERDSFDLELDLQGTDFQKKVWQELLKVPFGKTISYKELSLRLGDPKAVRAVAAANGANPVSIIIPCHRVLGSDGSLTGYGGGLWRKRWLLEHESRDLLLL